MEPYRNKLAQILTLCPLPMDPAEFSPFSVLASNTLRYREPGEQICSKYQAGGTDPPSPRVTKNKNVVH